MFTLAVDDFGVKYVGKEHADHLIQFLKTDYELTKDWTGDVYCSIQNIWDYNAQTLDISMLGYFKKVLHKYKHCVPSKLQHCPYSPSPKQNSTKAQEPLPANIPPLLPPDKIKKIQHIIGSILYYARAINITVLMALRYIAIKQTKRTTSTMEKAKQLLDFLATNPNATMRFKTSDMIMNIHLDALYLSEQTHGAERTGIFSWVGTQKTVTLSN